MAEKINQRISGSEESSEKKTPDATYMISIMWKFRNFIGIATGTVTILAFIVSLLLTEYFKSTAILLPDTDKSKLGLLGGGISDLAAMAGVNFGGEGSIAKLYPTIIKSESVLNNVIHTRYKTKKYADPVDLIQYWEIKEKTPEREYEVALIRLRNSLDVSMDIKTSVLTMSIETEEPELSADVLNEIISTLDNFIRTKRNTNASEQRKWIEMRLIEVKSDLSKAENALKEFREKNRAVSGSPQLLLNQERLVRELQINSNIYVELKKQYEIVKIEEIRTTPIINVLDYGRAAAKKSKPKKVIIALIWALIAFVGSSSYRIIEEAYGKTIMLWFKQLKAM